MSLLLFSALNLTGALFGVKLMSTLVIQATCFVHNYAPIPDILSTTNSLLATPSVLLCVVC